jgi:alpha,alpha-trehalase
MIEIMKPKIKKIVSMLPLQKADNQLLTIDNVKTAREYVNDYWVNLLRDNKNDTNSLIGLPKPYLVPSYEESHSFDFNELYYWDSYFMVQGMLDLEHKDLVMGILEDLISVYNRFNIIPNGSRTYLTGRSQPPFLSSFIWDLYEAYDLGTEWLTKNMKTAENEYNTVWMGTKKPNERLVYEGLSRYYDINHLDDLAEAESGWDMTPRFNRRALNFLPVDLNCLLYKYESDFAKTAKLIGDNEAQQHWEKAMASRARIMNMLMWDNRNNMFYDYNFTKDKLSSTASLASFYTLWCGMADHTKAKKLVKSLSRFECRGGLTATEKASINIFSPYQLPMQWAYPNGWAPLHFIVVKGLQNYGYEEEARRIALKWVKTNLNWFNKNHVFLEKYNVVKPSEPPQRGVYSSQTGFGWTNAVFERFCQDFIDD